MFVVNIVVRGEEDLSCEAGEGVWKPTDIGTSGSQCSDVSKITKARM